MKPTHYQVELFLRIKFQLSLKYEIQNLSTIYEKFMENLNYNTRYRNFIYSTQKTQHLKSLSLEANCHPVTQREEVWINQYPWAATELEGYMFPRPSPDVAATHAVEVQSTKILQKQIIMVKTSNHFSRINFLSVKKMWWKQKHQSSTEKLQMKGLKMSLMLRT